MWNLRDFAENTAVVQDDGQRFLRHQNRRADRQMRVQNRNAVSVIHRQSRNRTFRRIQFQVFDNGIRVGANVLVALTNEFRRSRRPRRRQ